MFVTHHHNREIFCFLFCICRNIVMSSILDWCIHICNFIGYRFRLNIKIVYTPIYLYVVFGAHWWLIITLNHNCCHTHWSFFGSHAHCYDIYYIEYKQIYNSVFNYTQRKVAILIKHFYSWYVHCIFKLSQFSLFVYCV